MVDEAPSVSVPAEGGNGHSPELRALATQDALLDRLRWAREIGMTFAGNRDVHGVLGYAETVTAQQYRAKYARGGIAKRLVDAKPSSVWRGEGSVFEDEDPKKETKFEQEFEALNSKLHVWAVLQRAHILASLSSFSVLLLGAPGEFETELPKGKPGGLLYVTPFSGGVVPSSTARQPSVTSTFGADVFVSKWDEDAKSERFGKPLEYQLKRTNINSPQLQRPVHWSRVVHIPSEGFLDDAIYGPPVLEAVWNYLDDLDKVVGGGAEAFWIRANQGLHIDIDKKMALTDAKNTVEELKTQVDAYMHNMQRAIRTRGVNISPLGSDVADFSQSADAIMTLIAGTSGIPKRILTGSEMGDLASTQDRNNWNDQVKDCRTSYAHPIVLGQFIGRLIKYGYLSTPKQWLPFWPDVDAMTMAEQLDAAKKMISLNDHGERVVEGNEVREFLGREPLEEEDEDPEEEIVNQLEAALRKGGTLSLAVRP